MRTFIAVVLAGTWGVAAQAAVITGLTATASSENAGAGRTAAKAINGVGLTGLQHSTLDTDGWETAAALPPVPATLTITLPSDPNGAWNITSFRIWNRNDGAFYYRAAENIDIATSTNGVDWTQRLNTNLLQAPGVIPTPTPTYTGELFTPASKWEGVQYFRITINSLLPAGAGQGHVGIAEVQLSGYVPEPASLVVLAAGVVTMMTRRRRLA